MIGLSTFTNNLMVVKFTKFNTGILLLEFQNYQNFDLSGFFV